MKQDRIPLTDIEKYIKDKVSFNPILLAIWFISIIILTFSQSSRVNWEQFFIVSHFNIPMKIHTLALQILYTHQIKYISWLKT
jgi:hypothetical protein